MNVKGIRSFIALDRNQRKKTEECDLKKMKTKGEMRSLLNAPQDPVRIGLMVRLT